MTKNVVWILAAVFAVLAGWTDWRTHRIPNWLTLPGLAIGVVANTIVGGWPGAKASLLGAGLGLAVLLPLVLVRSLGAGDWKLVGAVGAYMGPQPLIMVLTVAILVAGLMAVALIIWKRRVGQTLRNIAHMLGSLLSLHLPGSELSLDNPESLKIPFGVAVAVAVILYTARQTWTPS